MHLEIRWSLVEQGTGHQEEPPTTRDADDNALTREFGMCLLDSLSICAAAGHMEKGGCPQLTLDPGWPRVWRCQLARSWAEQALVSSTRNTRSTLVA